MQLFTASGTIGLGLIALLGAIFGSFFNMLIYRVPRGISIISPSSTCPQCGHRLKWNENIPIISYLILRGRCAECSSRIPLRYLVVEIITSVAFVMAFKRNGFSLPFFVEVLFFSLLILVTFTDLETYIIPDIYSIGGTILGFLLSGINPVVTWKESLLGIVLGLAILLFISIAYFKIRGKEGMGGGDIKFMALIGAFTGYTGVIVAMFVSAIVGLIAGIIVMVKSKEGFAAMIPYGPFLAFGALVAYLWADNIIGAYLTFVGLQ